MSDLFKHFGSLAVAILLAGLLVLVLRWPQGKNKTFSQHAAAHKHTIYYYIFLFILTLPIIITFFLGWFAPAFGLSIWFSIIVVASSVLQLSVTLIPEVGGWKTVWHKLLTFCSAVLLVPALCLVLLSSQVNSVGKLVGICGLVSMVGVMLIFALNRQNQKNLLLLQAGYYASFFAVVLFLTYTNHSY